MDQSTYPYLPSKTDESILDSISISVLKRLSSYRKPLVKLENDHSKENKETKDCRRDSQASPSVTNHKSPCPSVKASANSTDQNKKNSSKEDSKDHEEQLEKRQLTKPKPRYAVGGAKADLTRTDFKHTLQSMGLRCEDFTISVYPKDQAQAILRKQGVDTANHMPHRPQPRIVQPRPRPPQPLARPIRCPTPRHSMFMPHYPRPRLPPAPLGRPPLHRNLILPPNISPVVPPPNMVRGRSSSLDEDDDDCVILDPPEGLPKMLPTVKPQPQQPKQYLQQFQLMGTTVQVNRAVKRPIRPQSNAPLPKRPNYGRPFKRHQEHHRIPAPSLEDTSETSVEDTLKRLKNHNISITCRRNVSHRFINRDRNSDSEEDLGQFGSPEDDDGDLARFLECEIDEENRLMGSEDNEYLELNSSGEMPEETLLKNKQSISVKRGGKRTVSHSYNSNKEDRLNSTVELEEGDSNDNGDDGERKRDDSDKSEHAAPENDNAKKSSQQLTREEKQKGKVLLGSNSNICGIVRDDDQSSSNEKILLHSPPPKNDRTNKESTQEVKSEAKHSYSSNNHLQSTIKQRNESEELEDKANPPPPRPRNSVEATNLSNNANSKFHHKEEIITTTPSPKVKTNVESQKKGCVDHQLDDDINEELEEQLLAATSMDEFGAQDMESEI